MTLKKDPNDKYQEYEVDFHANEPHTDEEVDKEHDGKIADWHQRHADKVLDTFCDTHPSAPQCKVYDD